MQDDEPTGILVQDNRLDKIFFAKQVCFSQYSEELWIKILGLKEFFCFLFSQVINNACATQAIVSVLLNCKHPDVTLGPNLQALKNFCQGFDAGISGLALSNSNVIRKVHNSFSR